MTPTIHKAVFCTFQVEGVHQLLERAAEAYQQDVHRHLFHFRVSFNANSDHDYWVLDPIRIRRICLQQLNDFGGIYSLPNFGEMQALNIAEWLAKSLFDAFQCGVTVEVSEDGENGAMVTVGREDV
jgi:6-pyruvoyl-tetrahydropterin synthase